MSTRSTISVVKDNGKIESIYCHFDGYVDGVGKVLNDFYNSKEKALELVHMGDMSSIDETITDCVFYCRDRDEELNVELYQDGADFARNANQEYNYIFLNNKWYVFCERSNPTSDLTIFKLEDVIRDNIDVENEVEVQSVKLLTVLN